MITAFLITIIPSLLLYILFPKIGIHIKSQYLKWTFAWLAGLYIFTFVTFFLAIAYTFFTLDVLSKALYTTLLLTAFCFFVVYKDLDRLLSHARKYFTKHKKYFLLHTFLLGFCFWFAYAFLSPHLSTHDGSIFRSTIYWDFHWHVGVIQNFAFGDNFPPQNESFAGGPMTYHFFGDLVMAMYEVGGLTLTDAVTFSSILFLFFALVGIIGFCDEIFHAKWLGFVAVLLTITTSSLHFLYYFSLTNGVPLWQQIANMVTSSQHPWYASFAYSSPFPYNGTMFNLFYFLEERHMFLAPVFILFVAWIIYKRKTLPPVFLLIAGISMGAFFYWHAFITIMILVVLFFIFVFDGDRKKTLVLLGTCFIVFFAQYIALASSMNNSAHYIPDATRYPQFNMSYAASTTKHATEAIAKDLFIYYGFAYGLKLLLAPIGLFLIWRKDKRLGIILIAFTLPIFIIINTLQFSPTGVGENHKFLLNMNIFLNIATAYVLYHLLIKGRVYMYLGILCTIIVTLSGVIEHAPFIHSKPTEFYSRYNASSIAQTIRTNTPPNATIVGDDFIDIHLAGRKLFVGASAGPSESLNKPMRISTVSNIYRSDSLETFCKITKLNNIHFVEFTKHTNSPIKSIAQQLPHFAAGQSYDYPVYFVDINKSCR